MAEPNRNRSPSLNATQVVEIKRLISEHVEATTIAKLFGVTSQTICDIRRGKFWSQIPTPPLKDQSLPGEVWRPVVGCESHYSVSNLGRVRREQAAPGARVGRILKHVVGTNGYVFLGIWSDGHQRPTVVHELVAAAFLGPRPPGWHVNHKSGDKTDPRLDNLEYVTPRENLLHAFRTGLHKHADVRGDKNPAHKLSVDDVRQIREHLKRGESHRSIGNRFGVSKAAIGLIARGRTWASAA